MNSSVSMTVRTYIPSDMIDRTLNDLPEGTRYTAQIVYQAGKPAHHAVKLDVEDLSISDAQELLETISAGVR